MTSVRIIECPKCSSRKTTVTKKLEHENPRARFLLRSATPAMLKCDECAHEWKDTVAEQTWLNRWGF